MKGNSHGCVGRLTFNVIDAMMHCKRFECDVANESVFRAKAFSWLDILSYKLKVDQEVSKELGDFLSSRAIAANWGPFIPHWGLP